MVKKNPCRDLIWWKKIPANSNAEKKYSYPEEIAHSPPPPPPTKIKWSVLKSIQKQIVEYDLKSKCPEEYSAVDKVGSEKPLACKSCFV